MTTDAQKRLASQVVKVAQGAVMERGFATPIDVLVGLGWLTQAKVQEWRQGRIPYLEGATTANLSRISRAMSEFRRWARATGVRPSRTEYMHRGQRLRFSKTGDFKLEEAYRTRYVCKRRLPPAVKDEGAVASLTPTTTETSCGA